MVVVALVTRSIWALVLGGIVTGATRLVLSHAFLPGSADRFYWDAASVRALLRFGRWIFTSTLLTFAAMQSDRLIFGKLVTMSELGVYSKEAMQYYERPGWRETWIVQPPANLPGTRNEWAEPSSRSCWKRGC